MRLSKLIILITSGILSSSLAPAQTVPQFAARQDYISTYTYWVEIGDTNGDGIPDMIGTNEGAGVFVLFGNGDGTFRYGPFSDLTSGLEGTYFQVADVNGDGILDFVFSAFHNSGAANPQMLVALGNGDGTFSLSGLYPVGTDSDYAGNPVVMDFNGDGKLDVAVCDHERDMDFQRQRRRDVSTCYPRDFHFRRRALGWVRFQPGWSYGSCREWERRVCGLWFRKRKISKPVSISVRLRIRLILPWGPRRRVAFPDLQSLLSISRTHSFIQVTVLEGFCHLG